MNVKTLQKRLSQGVLSLSVMMPSFVLAEPAEVDMIAYGDYVVTMVEGQDIIENGAVAVKDGTIVAVGSRTDIDESYQSELMLDGRGRILMPGLVNGHTHSAMTLFRGMADDLDLMTWLNDYIFPMEAQFVTPEFVEVGASLACWEMIRGGTTTFVDMYFYPETIAEVMVNCGLRAIIAAPTIDYPSPGFKGWEDSYIASVDFVSRWQGKNNRITAAFAPHSPYTVTPEHLRQITQSAVELEAPLSIHVAEAPTETDIIKKRYKNTPVKHLAKQGMLDASLIAAHMVHPSSEEIKILSEKKSVGVVHNPTSNLKLAAGIAPVIDMLKAGINVGLGTDGAASNNDLDLWEEMRLAVLIHKQKAGDPTAISALDVLKMATSMGADAIGLGGVTGRLKPGMYADMIQVAINGPRAAPFYNVYSHLVYVADSNDVVSTIVAGTVLMDKSEVLTLDAFSVKSAAQTKGREIAQALEKRKNAKPANVN